MTLHRTIAALLLVATTPTVASAQATDPARIAAERMALAKFAWMDGTWRGIAVSRGPGIEHSVTQTERIGPMLGGTLRVIEGRGYNPDGSVGFNAFAIISYDPAAKAYSFTSYAQGRAGNFVITPTGNDPIGTGYTWDIPAGPATIHYTATFDQGVWHEVGDRILPGRPPVRFFEMTLTRLGATAWPAAGGTVPK